MSGLKRVYSDEVEVQGGCLRLSEQVQRYLINVLRSEEGERFELLTPKSIYSCKLLKPTRKESLASVENKRAVNPPSYSLTACQSLLKREYMDAVIDKYAELGATKIIPLISERSIRTLSEKTRLRYRQIAVSAALTSRNEFIAEIAEGISIQELEVVEGDNILFYEKGIASPLPPLRSSSVQFVLGPEGGFTQLEADNLIQKGFTSATPFPYTLKAQTAGALFCGLLRARLANTL